MSRTPGQAALLRVKLARCAFEVALHEYRVRTKSSARADQPQSKHLSDPAVKAADVELSAALEQMEAMP